MNLVLFTDTSPSRLPPPQLAPEQVNCGPGFETVVLAGRTLSLRTPRGPYDAAAVVNQLWRWQVPDVVAVQVEARGSAWPRGLGRIPCPKVLLVGEARPDAEFLAKLAGYLRREPFDRVILTSDRRQALQLQDRGVKGVAWLPGWLFPHSDAEVERSRTPQRGASVAVCVRADNNERDLLGLTTAMARQGLPTFPRMLPEPAVLAHYGSSEAALVCGGIDLSLFQALAAGAATLSTPLAADSGWESICPGRTIPLSGGEKHLVERAKHIISRPKDARALGEKGMRWFSEHFNARHRQTVFSALVLDNRVQPEFALPERSSTTVGVPEIPPLPAKSASAPSDAAGQQARELLEIGDKPKALASAMAALKGNASSWESMLVLAELALGEGNADLWRSLLGKARSLAPEDNRLARLELASPGFLKDCHAAEAMAKAWQACENREWLAATTFARRALSWNNASAEAILVAGHAGGMQARQQNLWMEFGKMLNLLQLAAEASPLRADLWHELAVARRKAGGVLPDAVTAYRTALQLDPERLVDWFGLGEALLALDDAEGAAAALSEAVKRAPQSLGMSDWLGHALKRQGRLLDAHACHLRGFGPAKAAQLAGPAGKRRAVFVLQNGHGWPCFSSVYDEFVRDPAWETIVVGLPWLHPSFENSTRKDQDKVFEFLAEKRIPHMRWTDFPLTENAADIIFLQNPYDSVRPEGWKVPALVAAGHRICYVPYAIELGASREALEYQFDMRLHRYAWAIFARSEAHRDLFGQHCLSGNRHVAVTGHPKFDDLGRSNRIEPDPELVAFARGRPLVLWNPHFDARLNGTRFGDGFSTFLRWRDFILQEFARHPDLAFVIRPHPNFFSAMEERCLMSRGQLDRFVEQCGEAGIFIHRSPAYFPMLAAADAIVSDGSSLLIEFGITGKPVCYLHNPSGPMAHPDYELDFDYVRQHTVWATEERHIRSFLDGVRDLMADQAARDFRTAELRRRMGVDHEAIGLKIKREIEKRLMLEQTPATLQPAA